MGLDVHTKDTPDYGGWVKNFDDGALLSRNAKTGWREVEIGRGSSEMTRRYQRRRDRFRVNLTKAARL